MKAQLLTDITQRIKEIFKTEAFIPLHLPTLQVNKKKYLNDYIDSTFVSSVGKFVNTFEEVIQSYCGFKHAIVFINGNNALHICLNLVGVETNDEILT